MKNISKLRLTLVISVLLVAGANTFAQTSNYAAAVGTNYITVPVSTAEATDTVAVGARMPYYVVPDADIDAAITLGFMNKSIFKWEFPTSAGTPQTYGGAATATQPEADYFKENEVSVVWSTEGDYTIKVTEKSVPKSGTGCEDASPEVRNVVVQKLPTFAFNGATSTTGACVGTITFSLPVSLSGSGPWKVSYTIAMGGNTETVIDQEVSNGKMPYTSSITTLPLPVDLTTGVFSGLKGTYIVTVTNVTDRITAKALNTLPVLAGNVDAAKKTFTIGLIATPNTSPIQHLKNL